VMRYLMDMNVEYGLYVFGSQIPNKFLRVRCVTVSYAPYVGVYTFCLYKLLIQHV